MPLPEWGRSYNALSVPLTSDWQCSLVSARDVEEPTKWWSLSYDERQKKRKEREEQIDHDRRDFDRLFRVSTSRRDARACRDFSAYVAFIREHLRISGLSTPVDGDGVTCILRDAVRDGWLVPAIDRTWRGSRRVARFYAPQSWPKRAPDPKPTVYGVRDGQFIPLNADGSFVDYTPYVPFKDRVAATASSAVSSASGFDWLGAVETAAGAVLGDDGALDDDFASRAGEDSTPLGDAQAFEYQPDIGDGDSIDVAGIPNMTGDPNSWIESGPGMKKQWRMFDSDGNAAVDIDFDSHHGQPNPHVHNWDGNSRDKGWPVSILPW
jgi:hypothetical protein